MQYFITYRVSEIPYLHFASVTEIKRAA